MIGVNQFAKLGVSSMEEIYEQATRYYIAGKEPQARHLIIAMSVQQRKDYFFYVLEMYPENKPFLQFVMYLV